MRISDFARFFRDEHTEDEADNFHRSRNALDWMAQPYHHVFLEWLDSQAAKPLNVKDGQMDLIQSAVRANTFREIRDYLKRVEREATAAVRQASE